MSRKAPFPWCGGKAPIHVPIALRHLILLSPSSHPQTSPFGLQVPMLMHISEPVHRSPCPAQDNTCTPDATLCSPLSCNLFHESSAVHHSSCVCEGSSPELQYMHTRPAVPRPWRLLVGNQAQGPGPPQLPFFQHRCGCYQYNPLLREWWLAMKASGVLSEADEIKW